MRLDPTRRADYAIRAVLALGRATDEGCLSGRRLAADQGIPTRFLSPIMGDLVRAGLVLGPPGPRSSCRLALPDSTRSVHAGSTMGTDIKTQSVADRTSQGMDEATIELVGAPAERAGVPLHLEARAQVDLERVPGSLEANGWLGAETAPDRGMRRLESDLVLGVGSDLPIVFRKSMIVRLGPLSRAAHGWSVPIEWQAATLAPLFPVFVGRVLIDRDRIAIDGHYAPPFGVIGAVLDRAVLGIAARATARVLLARFVDAFSRL